MIVADASALVELLVGTAAGKRLEDRLLGPGEPLHAPHLVDVEVSQAIRKLVLCGEIDEAAGMRAMKDLGDLPLLRYPHVPFLPRIWALRGAMSACDAAYVALAEALGATFVTRDTRLAKTAQGLVAVET